MFKTAKKGMKILGIAAALFFAGCAAPTFTAFNPISTAAAAATQTVGLLDFDQAMNNHPGLADAEAEMKKAIEEAQSNYEAKAKTMNDADKQAYYGQMRQRIETRRQEIIEPLRQSIIEASQRVMEAKSLSIIIEKHYAVCGGVDITKEVIAKLQKIKK